MVRKLRPASRGCCSGAEALSGLGVWDYMHARNMNIISDPKNITSLNSVHNICGSLCQTEVYDDDVLMLEDN